MKRLLGLLLVMGIVGCGGGEPHPFEQLGAWIERNKQGEIVKVSQLQAQTTDAGRVHLKGLTKLQTLVVGQTRIIVGDASAVALLLFMLGALPLLIGVAGLTGHLRAKLTPTSPIREIKKGRVEVKGKVKAIGPLLKSPLSHQDCVLYAVFFNGGGGLGSERGIRASSTARTRGNRTLFEDIQSTPFVIHDGTGVAELDETELVLRNPNAEYVFGPDINKHIHRGSVPPDISDELKAKLSDSVLAAFDGTFMRGSNIKEYYLKPGEDVFFVGKAEDNSQPAEPHWLMKEVSFSSSKGNPENVHSDQILIQRGSEQLGPYTLEQVNNYLNKGTFSLTDKAKNENLADFIPIHQIPGVKINTGAQWRLRGHYTNKSEEEFTKKGKWMALIGLPIAAIFIIPAILILVLN